MTAAEIEKSQSIDDLCFYEDEICLLFVLIKMRGKRRGARQTSRYISTRVAGGCLLLLFFSSLSSNTV